MKWIKITDRLPPANNDYLCKDGLGMKIRSLLNFYDGKFYDGALEINYVGQWLDETDALSNMKVLAAEQFWNEKQSNINNIVNTKAK